MNKLKLLVFLLIPVFASGQLDKIKQGMTKEELKKVFPALKPDPSAMSSWIYTVDSVQGIKGSTEYVISQDTLLRYDFTSKIVSGPCKDYPNVDNRNFRELQIAALRLFVYYDSLYGKPVEFNKESELEDDHSEMPVSIFFALWKHGNDELSIRISRPGKRHQPEMNGPPLNEEEMKPGCKYSLEVLSVGRDKTFLRAGGTGSTGHEFVTKHPELASQVENHPDSWIVEDTSSLHSGTWRFAFEGGNLDSYSLDVYDGPGYVHNADTTYSLLGRRVKELFSEAGKVYGKPDTLINRMPAKYPVEDNKIYHHTMFFAAEWKRDDKKLYVIFDKSAGGKQFEPVFHLLLYYGRSLMEH